MATLVQSSGTFVSTSGTSVPKPYGSNVTAGNLLICHMAVAIVAASTFSVTDSQGNTWQAATGQAVSSAWKIQTFWTKAGSSGANTVTAARSTAASTDERVINISEFAPTAGNVWPTNPVDGANTANGTTANPSLNVTVAAGASLLTGGVATTGSATPGAGYITLVNQDGNEFEYDLTPGSGSVAVPFVAPASTWAACAASFLEASGVTPANTGYGDDFYGVGSYGIRLDSFTPIAGSDSAAVTDSAAIAVTLASSESITAGDAGAVAAALDAADSIAHSDTSTSINAAVAGSDALSHSEATTADATVAATESHTQTETGALANTADASDPATQSDVSGIVAALTAADSETSTDSSAKSELYSGADSSAFSDAGAIAATVATSEAATLTDAAAVAAATIVTDAWALADSAVVQSVNAVPVTDTATQSDAGAVVAAVAAADTTAFSDAVSVAATAAATDAHVMSESVFAGEFADKLVSEAAVLSEAAALANAVAASDAWATADAISSLAASLAATDPLTLLDAAAALANVTALDSGAFTDIGSVVQGSTSISASDAVTLMESVALANALDVSDSWLFNMSGSYRTAVLASSPRNYWRLGEAAGSAIDTMGNNNGTYGTGDTRAVAGLQQSDTDGAVILSGASGATSVSSIRVTGSVALAPPFTLEAWVNPATGAMADHWTLFSVYDATGLVNYVSLIARYNGTLSGTTGALAYRDNINGFVSSGVSLGQGTPRHVAMSLDTSNVLTFYRDGAQVGQTTLTSALPTGMTTLIIGANPVPRNTDKYKGTVDEFAIYTNILTPTQIQTHYLASFGNAATVDVLTVKTALDNWVLSEATGVLQGIPAPMLRLPLTAAIVARAAVSSVVSQLAAMAVQARNTATQANAPSMSAEVDGNLGQTVPSDRSAKTTPSNRSANVSGVNYG